MKNDRLNLSAEEESQLPELLFGDTEGGEDPGCCSALATAVRGCREALMSCIMGVRRDAGMGGGGGGDEGRERARGRNQILAPALHCTVLLRLWVKVNVEPPAACILHI